jgi:hypothetical protein
VVASDRRAADQLDRLWQLWQAGRKLPRGWATWRPVFERLDVVRRWDDRDRLSRTGALEVWRQELADRAATDLIPLEVELWFRASSDRRDGFCVGPVDNRFPGHNQLDLEMEAVFEVDLGSKK